MQWKYEVVKFTQIQCNGITSAVCIMCYIDSPLNVSSHYFFKIKLNLCILQTVMANNREILMSELEQIKQKVPSIEGVTLEACLPEIVRLHI